MYTGWDVRQGDWVWLKPGGGADRFAGSPPSQYTLSSDLIGGRVTCTVMSDGSSRSTAHDKPADDDGRVSGRDERWMSLALASAVTPPGECLPPVARLAERQGGTRAWHSHR